MADETIVTELIVDARGATSGVDQYEAALNRAGAATDKVVNKQAQIGPAAATAGQRLEESARSISAAARAADAYVARLDPVFFAQQRIGKEAATVQTALNGLEKQMMTGAISVEQFNSRTALLQGRLGEVKAAAAGLAQGTTSATDAMRVLSTQVEKTSGSHTALAGTSNAARFAVRDLGVQSIDVFTQLASGAPVLTTFIQQGSQVGQVMAVSGTSVSQLAAGVRSGLLSALSAIVSPLGLVVTGAVAVTAAIVGFGTAAENSARRVEALRNQLSLVRGDYVAASAEAEAAAKKLAASSFLGTADARAGVNAIYANPDFRGTQQQAIDTALAFARLSKALQETAPNWDRLREAMNDPVALLEKLRDQNHLAGIDGDFIRHIRTLQETGKGYQATAETIDKVSAAVAKVKENETPLEKALGDLGKAFTKTGQDGRSLADAIGTVITDAAAAAVRSLGAVVTGIESLRQAANSKAPNVGNTVAAQWEMQARGMVPVGLVPSGGGDYSGFVPRGIRNNNPLNLTYLPGQGAIGNDGRFGIYGTMQEGVAANAAQLLRYQDVYGLNTVGGIINRWAPPGENDTAGYAASVAKSMGVGINDQINLREIEVMNKLIAAMSAVENGPNSPRPPALTSLPGGANDNRGFVADPQKAVDDARKAADALGVQATAYEKANKQVDLFREALSKIDKSNPNFAALTQGLQAAQLALYNAIGPAAQLVRTIDLQTNAQQRMAQAWDQGAKAAALQGAQIKAETEALAFAAPGTEAYAQAVNAIADAHVREAAAQQAVQAAQKANDNQSQLTYLQAQLNTLGQTDEVRNRTLATLRAQQEIEKSFPLLDEARKRTLIDQAAAQADLTTKLQQQQQALNEIGNLATQAFDQVGAAITQAFVQGQGAAVNFGNVARSIASAVIQEFAKLAIINPLLNSLIGGNNRTTLDQVVSAVGGSSGSSGGGALGSLSSGASLLSGGSSILEYLGFQGIGSQLGITGPGGILSSLGLGGVGSGIGSILSTPIFGSSAFSAATNAAILSSVPGGIGPATVGSLGLGGATIGSVLGSVGGGFSLGSIGGGFLQSSLGKVGPAPMIGAGLGAVAGYLLGGPLGGLIGGSLGGLGGGLIGPKKASAYSTTGISLDDGQLSVGNTLSQLVDASGEREQAISDVTKINALLDSLGAKLASIGALSQIGQNTPGGYQDPSKFSDLASAFAGFRFTSDNPNMAFFLNGASFSSADAFNTVTSAVKGFIDAVSGTDFAPKINDVLYKARGLAEADISNYVTNAANFVNQVVPALEALNKNTGALETQIDAINQQFAAAIATAHELTYKEAELTAARDAAIRKMQAEIDAQYLGIDQDLVVRRIRAQNPNLSVTDQQFIFDIGAQRQRDAFSKQMTDLYGDAFKTSSAYADQMALLEQALGAERLAIQTSYADQIAAQAKVDNEKLAAQAQAAAAQAQAAASQAQAANDNAAKASASVIASLEQYTRGLQTSSASPLSARDQLALARSQFGAVSGAASAGDYTSIGQLQSYSDVFLNASRAVNGSGAAYVTDFNRVVDALSNVGKITPDTLTASVLQTETRTQTAVLVEELGRLRAAVTALQDQVRQTNATPVRLAA